MAALGRNAALKSVRIRHNPFAANVTEAVARKLCIHHLARACIEGCCGVSVHVRVCVCVCLSVCVPVRACVRACVVPFSSFACMCHVLQMYRSSMAVQ